MTVDDTRALAWIRKVLQLLAADADDQLRYLQDAGISGVVDELALEFEDTLPFVARLVEHGRVPADARTTLDALDEALDRLSDAGAQAWTEAALGSDPRWQRVRELAAISLAVLPAPSP